MSNELDDLMTDEEMTAARETCARILGTDAAVAIGRFRPEGPLGYRARSVLNAPLRATRTEAESDERAHWEQIDANH